MAAEAVDSTAVERLPAAAAEGTAEAAERLPVALAEGTAEAAERLPVVLAEGTAVATTAEAIAAGTATVAVIAVDLALASAMRPTGAAITRRITAVIPTMTPTAVGTATTAIRITGAGVEAPSSEVMDAATTAVGTSGAGTPDAAMLAAGQLAAQLGAVRSAVGSAVSADAECFGMKRRAADSAVATEKRSPPHGGHRVAQSPFALRPL